MLRELPAMRQGAWVGAVATALLVAACTGPSDRPDRADGGGGTNATPDVRGPRITVWTGTDDVAGARQGATEFTADTGIRVDIVPVRPERIDDRLDVHVEGRADGNGAGDMGSGLSRQATGTATPFTEGQDLPDVIGGLPLVDAHALAAAGLVDIGAVEDVVEELGVDTFRADALRLATRAEGYIAVPSDAWTQVIVYRKDLFAERGLPVPDTFRKLRRAATKLEVTAQGNGKRGKGGAGGNEGNERPHVARLGIALPTDSDDPATARTFEHLALANGCRLADENGEVTLDSTECVRTFDFYASLGRGVGTDKHGRGDRRALDASAARRAYLAGKAAIVPASSSFLDAVGNLDSEEKPTCPRCTDDPAFLARNSGVVTAIRGPDGTRPVQYGGMESWTILSGQGPSGGATNATEDTDDAQAATEFVTFMMDEGYLGWLGQRPSGNLPLRTGTSEAPSKFIDAWGMLPSGAGAGESIAEVYPSTVLDLLRASPGSYTSWGLSRGQATLMAAMRQDLTLASAVNALTRGSISPSEAAQRAQRRAEALDYPALTPTSQNSSPSVIGSRDLSIDSR